MDPGVSACAGESALSLSTSSLVLGDDRGTPVELVVHADLGDRGLVGKIRVHGNREAYDGPEREALVLLVELVVVDSMNAVQFLVTIHSVPRPSVQPVLLTHVSVVTGIMAGPPKPGVVTLWSLFSQAPPPLT